jgi:hypothetical protein
MEGRDARESSDSGTGDGQPDEAITGSPEELYELGGRLLERGDARRSAEVFAAAVGRLEEQRAGAAAGDPAPGPGDPAGAAGPADPADAAGPADPADAAGPADPARGRLLAGLGIARLEEALATFREAAEWAGPDVRPLAVELLARALPLRDRDHEAAQVWRWGLEDPDPDVAAAVRARLRRAFGTDGPAGAEGSDRPGGPGGPGGADGTGQAGGSGSAGGPDVAGAGAVTGAVTGAAAPWWDGFLESAVCHGTLPLLTGELFAALDHMYAVAAVAYARGGTRTRELRDALAEAVRLPAGYAWGAELQDSFRRRLRDATGAEAGALPPSSPGS